jgi:type I restriction enzyme S subunit
MQKYSKYQETDLLWMGEVPSHWRKDKISRMVEFSASGGTPTSTNESYYDGEIKWVQTGELNDCEIFDSEKKLTDEGFKASSTKLFPAETLLIAMYGATIGKLGILKTEATTNQACCALFFNTKKWNTKYFFYYFLNIREKLIFSSYGGGQPNISQEVIKQERLFVPPFTEQTAIAAYLDQATANIDNVIATKQKQLEKLEHYKQSKIHECVTKGLNPDVTLKPSGIDWIGDVPEHWKIERLKDISTVVLGKMLCNEDKGNYHLRPYLKSKNIGWNELLLDKVEEMWFSDNELENLRVKKKDILMTEGGEVGKTSIWNDELYECYIQNSVHKITFNRKNNPRYYLYLLNYIGSLGVFTHLVSTVSIGHLTKEKLVIVKVVVPTLQEQNDIANYIDDFCYKITKEKTIIEQQIEKLKQYRKCLIHECVTGKRKVIAD